MLQSPIPMSSGILAGVVRPSEIRIEAGRRSFIQHWPELVSNRELTWLLARREVQLRYRHSIAGIGWAVMRPLLTLLVLSMFQAFIGSKGEGVPYPLYAMTGLVLWTFLDHALTLGSSSILKYTSVIKKIYFPLLILPISSVLGASADFVVALPLIAALMVYYGYYPTLAVLLLPLFAIQLVAFAMAVGIWLALLNTKYRDTSNALPFVMQLWFFLTPIVYNAKLIPTRWRMVLGLNPMLGIMEGFRMALFGRGEPELGFWIASSWVITLLLLVSGVFLLLSR
jgi:lipopolysaccharide transport system permease protein